jgi:hypothetical protein
LTVSIKRAGSQKENESPIRTQGYAVVGHSQMALCCKPSGELSGRLPSRIVTPPSFIGYRQSQQTSLTTSIGKLLQPVEAACEAATDVRISAVIEILIVKADFILVIDIDL